MKAVGTTDLSGLWAWHPTETWAWQSTETWRGSLLKQPCAAQESQFGLSQLHSLA